MNSSSLKRTWKLQEFCAHTANVNCLAMGHKSNQVLATGGDDKKVNLWAIGRQGCLLSLSGHSTPVECVCFGHLEDMVCAGSQTGALKLWDLEAAKLLRTLTGHKGAVKCMDFHPYGGYLTTGSCDTHIKLWDTRQRGCICTYASHKMAVNSLQFSPDGQWIASGGDDGAVKVWDVRNGRVIEEFLEHAGSVSCVKFHPHEFLLASCGSDRVVNFWDMEKFQLISSTDTKMAQISRQLWFSEDGSCLLGAGGDGLQVLGWEPTRQFDVVPASWGQIYDMTVANNELIVGWFHSTNVVLNVVELSKVHPFGGPPPPGPPIVSTSPFQKNSSVRKSFSKERPHKQVVHRKSLLDERTVEESEGTEEDDSSAVIANLNDYTEIFRPNRALNRTPPPSTNLIISPESPTPVKDIGQPSSLVGDMRGLSLGNMDPPSPTYHSAPTSLNNEVPSQLPHRSYDSIQSIHSTHEDSDLDFKPIHVEPSSLLTPSSQGSRNLRRQHSDGEKKGKGPSTPSNNGSTTSLKSSTSEMSLGRSMPPRSLSFTRPSRAASDLSSRDYSASTNRPIKPSTTPVEIYVNQPKLTPKKMERSASPDFIPSSTDRPVGLDLEEFLPKSRTGYGASRGELSEQEVLSVMMGGHESMMAVLATRQRSLQIFHQMWMSKNLLIALESTVAVGDLSVILDILNVIVLRPSIWTLDICTVVLPQIKNLLQSKYESYMTTGCTVLRLVMRNFASVIATNVRLGAGGVDISREERVAKCRKCREVLMSIKSTLQNRRPNHTRLSSIFADLENQIDQNIP